MGEDCETLCNVSISTPTGSCETVSNNSVALTVQTFFFTLTTEQRAQGLGFWARGDGLSRASQLALAEWEAVGSQPTWCCDLDLALSGAVLDSRRLEVVVDGLPLFGGGVMFRVSRWRLVSSLQYRECW